MNAFPGTQTSGNQWSMATTKIGACCKDQQTESNSQRNSSPTFDSLEQQMAHFEAEHQRIVDELAKHYVMPPDSSVSEFLNGHRTVPALLIEAVPQLRKYFGAGAVIALSPSTDDAGPQTLYAVIYWLGSLSDAIAALNKFDEEWWLSRVAQASGYLTFTYELR